MKLKANHNLTMPDGKTEIKAGEEFEYKGDISSFKSVVSVISEEGSNTGAETPTKDPVTSQKMTDEQVRARGKELNIPNYYNKGIDKLVLEIAEKEKALDEAAAAAAQARQADEKPKDPEGKADGEGTTSNEGDANV